MTAIIGIVNRNAEIHVIVKMDRSGIKANRIKEPIITIIPAIIKPLPTYMFDLYQTFSLERVLGSLKPNNGFGLTF